MRACRYIDGNKIIPYYVISTLVRPSFPPLLSSHVSSGGRVKSFEETLIGSDFSFSRLLPLATLYLLLLYPRPHLPQELAARSRARMPEKIFPCRRHPSERESAVAWIFALFSPVARSSLLTAAPFPFRISMSTEHTVHGHEIFRYLVSSSFNSPSISLFFSPFPPQFDYINIC